MWHSVAPEPKVWWNEGSVLLLSRRMFLRSVPIVAAAAGCARIERDAFGVVDADRGADDVRIEDVAFKRTPRRDLSMTLYFPAGWQRRDRRPAIVFFFGGGWQKGNPIQFAPQAEYLARRGLVAACADYRVKSRDDVGPEICVEDAKSAVRWLRTEYRRLGIDPDRIVAGGGSAGGHLAACAGLTPDIVGSGEDADVSSSVCAMVLFNPVLNLVGSERHLERLGHDEDLARLISPTMHLHAGSPPAILFYGSNDALLAHGEEYISRAGEMEVRAEIYVTPDQGHGFFNSSPYLEQTLTQADHFLVSLGMLPPR